MSRDRIELVPIDKIHMQEGLGEFEERLCTLLKEAKHRFGWTKHNIVPCIKVVWEDMELIEKYGSLEEAIKQMENKK